MRLTGNLILLLVCVGVVLLLKVFKKLKKVAFIAVVLCAIVVFCGGSSIINLNTLSQATQSKLNKVVDVCGDSFVKTEGNKILVKVNDEWYDLEKVDIVGNFTKDCTITYDGKEINVGHSGVYDTIKFLEAVGLLNSNGN